MQGLSDTDPKVARMQIELLRQKTPSERLRLMAAMSEAVKRLSQQNLERKFNSLAEARLEWIRLNYGKELAEGFRKVAQKKL